jgi:hypothetical protein
VRVAAVFAMVWAVVRACVQSVTQDEADTYFWFASKSANYIFHPFPNNHVLNTLLIWITTRVFGLSTFSLRMPALMGAALYIFVCYFLCRRLRLQLPVFICLVYNPFIFDFMVAARGYGLANAFLMAAIAVVVWNRSYALASLALGLSFASTFSFAFVDLAAFFALLTWAIRRRETESVVRIVGSCVLPGLLVALLLCGYPLTHWPKGELYDSAHSLREMIGSLVDASLYQLNPRFLEIELYTLMDFLKPLLLPVLGALCVCQLVLTRERFAAALSGIVAFCVLLHWVAFRFDVFPLPMTRTAIFLIPLCTLAAGVIAASTARSRVSEWLGRGITGVFICLACYFLLCLRLTYFKDYKDDADTKDVYAVLARLNHAYGVTDTAMDGLYVAPLNFYRVLSKKETFPEFSYVWSQDFPTGKSIYVLHSGYYREFIEKERLSVVYRGKSTEAVVAVKPDGAIPAVMVEP